MFIVVVMRPVIVGKDSGRVRALGQIMVPRQFLFARDGLIIAKQDILVLVPVEHVVAPVKIGLSLGMAGKMRGHGLFDTRQFP
jgi:hypothetical protein